MAHCPDDCKHKYHCGDGGKRRSRQTGLPCAQPVSREGAACRFHGGHNPKGAAHPNFKHGRYSKYMRVEYRQMYDELRSDPELHSLREHIPVVDVLIADLLKRMQENEESAARHLVAVVEGWRQFRAAMATGDSTKLLLAARQMDEVVKAGPIEDPESLESRLLRVLESSRRMRDTEIRKVLGERAAVSPEVLVAVQARMVEIFAQEIMRLQTEDAKGVLTRVIERVEGMGREVERPN